MPIDGRKHPKASKFQSARLGGGGRGARSGCLTVIVSALAALMVVVGFAAPAHATATQACIQYRPSPIYAHSEVCAYAWYVGSVATAVTVTWDVRNPTDDVYATVALKRQIGTSQPYEFARRTFPLVGDGGSVGWDIVDTWLNPRGQLLLRASFVNGVTTVTGDASCLFP